MRNEGDSTQKRIVTELNFGVNTAKRAAWEAWELRVAAPMQVEVTNASYGVTRKADHRYTVTVDHRDDGLIVPLHCTCPSDQFGEADCKHKVALAIRGGPVVLGAAVAYTGDHDAVADQQSTHPEEVGA